MSKKKFRKFFRVATKDSQDKKFIIIFPYLVTLRIMAQIHNGRNQSKV